MKNIAFFIEKFVDQLTDAEVVDAQTGFQSLSSWDSLTSMAVINMIEDEFGVLVSDDDLKEHTTIQELFNLIESKL